VTPLDLDDAFLCVMTGAGVSAESGIPTFRDANGLWENNRSEGTSEARSPGSDSRLAGANRYAIEDVASPEGFARDPALVWRFYSLRREKAAGCTPNAGHRAIAAIEEKLGDRFLLVTQNVDGLHRRTGNERLVEIHGNLFTTRCSSCDRAPFDDERRYEGELPRCDRAACGALLRPHIVWFGEALDPRDLARLASFFESAARAKKRCVFLAAGTSGVVYPAAGMVHAAKRVGAETVLVNLEPPANVDAFNRVELGKSGEVLPRLLRT
jgi:NAD-dependent deacetylase